MTWDDDGEGNVNVGKEVMSQSCVPITPRENLAVVASVAETMMVMFTLIAQILGPEYAAIPPYAQPPLPTVSEDAEVDFEHGPCVGDGVWVLVGVFVGVGVGHAFAVAVKTSPAYVSIKSEKSWTTTGILHAPIQVVVTSPDVPEKDDMTSPDGSEA